MSILNSARSGKFSSDRSVRDYCNLVWRVDKIHEPAHHGAIA
jgi:starch phosphorylase